MSERGGPWIAFGRPGAAPEFRQQARHLDLADGEVCFPLADLPMGPVVIAADGSALEPMPATLAELKSARKREATAYLAQRLRGSVRTAAAGIVQCDDEAQAKITAKVASATVAKMQVDLSWRMPWRRTDDSWTEPLNADQMIALGKQVEGYVTACQFAYWKIADLIEKAASAAQVAAVDTAAGYPAAR